MPWQGAVLLSIRLESFRQTRRLVFAGLIALWARHPGATALASVRALPRLVRMVFANPAAVLTEEAVHRLVPRGRLVAGLFKSTLEQKGSLLFPSPRGTLAAIGDENASCAP